MIITMLKIVNWGPYRGEHVLVLDDSIYAVVARDEADAERSNWIGKTWLLWAPNFALYGTRPPEVRTEDDWITHGETAGSVELVLEDGTTIVRSRTRGKSTQLAVELFGKHENLARQAKAQEQIVELLGLASSDFESSCFIQQKQIDQLVTMSPSARTELVSDWLSLEPLQKAEALLKDQLGGCMRERIGIERELQIIQTTVEQLPARDVLLEEINVREAKILDAESMQVALEEQLIRHSEWQRHAENNGVLDGVIADGQTVKARVERDAATNYLPTIGALEKQVAELEVKRRQQAQRISEVARLLTGQFDGQCPVTRKDCPASAEIIAHGRTMSDDHSAAQGECNETLQKIREVKAERQQLVVAQEAQDADKRELERLRVRARELLPSRKYVEEHKLIASTAELRADSAKLREALAIARSDLATFQGNLERLDDVVAKQAELNVKLGSCDLTARTLREAVAIFGRGGAQREIALDELADIEQGANALLLDSGVDLTINVSWGFEGKDPAKVCSSCGAAFPQSRKIKECSTCGAERGLHRIERLDIVPSSVSGAAYDIAGLAFQLSVAAWLRARRETDWSVVLVDEAFAACDESNSRALTTRLHSLIRGRYSFRQGFVVAHNASLMEALPKRLQITRKVDGEMTIEVVG